MVKINPNEAVRSLNKAGNEVAKKVTESAPEKMHEVSEQTLKNVSDAQTAAGKAQLKKYVKPETDVESMEVENQIMAGSGTNPEGGSGVTDTGAGDNTGTGGDGGDDWANSINVWDRY